MMQHRGQRPLSGKRISVTTSAGPPSDSSSSAATPGPGSRTPTIQLGGSSAVLIAPSQPSLSGLSALSSEDSPSPMARSEAERGSSTTDELAAALAAPLPVDAPEPLGYLLIIEGTASSVFALPGYGEVTIGRAPEAQLRLLSPMVSRLHARIFISDGEARILDLGSHNGTRVNSELIAAAQPLASGDIIGISDVLLCFHRQVPRVLQRPVYPDPLMLRQRLEEEVDRCLRAGRRLRGGRRGQERRFRPPSSGFRGLALLCVYLAGFGDGDRGPLTQALAQQVRLMDVLAFDGRSQLLVLFPDVDELEAAQLAARLLSVIVVVVPGSRAGFACCPSDGCDGDTLLAGARGAMEAAQPGQVLPAVDAVQALQVGDRQLYFAEPALVRLHELCVRLSRSPGPVLILGEAGSGRETAAATIASFDGAQRSGARFIDPRAAGARPFLRVSCQAPSPHPDLSSLSSVSSLSSLSSVAEDSLDDLLTLDGEASLPRHSSVSLAALAVSRRLYGTAASLEVLLFGLERGAVPVIPAGRAGLVEAAAGGALYLSEVAALPLAAQGRLQRLLETGRSTRVGGSEELPVEVRILCSSSQDLYAEVRTGRFRADLLELLRGSLSGPPSGAVVVLPPLRERRRDLPILIKAFLRAACAQAGREPPLLTPAAMERLLFHGWPGNLRELHEAMEFLARGHDPVCEPEHLPPGMADGD